MLHKIADGSPVKLLAAMKLTVPQLLCLAADKPPPKDKGPETFEEYEALRAARLAEGAAWGD